MLDISMSRTELIEVLVKDFGKNAKAFNNTDTNKSNEKFWTKNRLIHYLWKLQEQKLSELTSR